MDFSDALRELKAGKKVARAGWNGKGMWLVYVPGTAGVQVRPDSPYGRAGVEVCDINPHVDMWTAQGTMQPGWLCSMTDMLADDWVVLP